MIEAVITKEKQSYKAVRKGGQLVLGWGLTSLVMPASAVDSPVMKSRRESTANVRNVQTRFRCWKLGGNPPRFATDRRFSCFALTLYRADEVSQACWEDEVELSTALLQQTEYRDKNLETTWLQCPGGSSGSYDCETPGEELTHECGEPEAPTL